MIDELHDIATLENVIIALQEGGILLVGSRGARLQSTGCFAGRHYHLVWIGSHAKYDQLIT